MNVWEDAPMRRMICRIKWHVHQWKMLAQEAEILDARRKEWQEYDVKFVDNVDEDIKIEDEEQEFDHEGAQTIEDPTQEFAPSSEVQALIATELEKSTLHRNALVLAELVDDKMITLQVGYDAAKEGVMTRLVNLVREGIVDIM